MLHSATDTKNMLIAIMFSSMSQTVHNSEENMGALSRDIGRRTLCKVKRLSGRFSYQEGSGEMSLRKFESSDLKTECVRKNRLESAPNRRIRTPPGSEVQERPTFCSFLTVSESLVNRRIEKA